MKPQIAGGRNRIMADICRIAQNSVANQGELFRLAERDHGLSLKLLSAKTGIAYNTLRSWRDGTVMPAWGLFKLGSAGGVPDYLLSFVAEPFERAVVTAEDGDGDFDTAGLDASELAHEVQRARHPASPGGTRIVPQEAAIITLKARKSASSARKVA
jgi:hypothetical protein